MFSLGATTVLFVALFPAQSSQFSAESDLNEGYPFNFDFENYQIFILNINNFKDYLYYQFPNKAWVIMFYHMSCGRCQKFAPIWNKLALETESWRNIIEVGIVECNYDNLPLCREYEIEAFPTISYFPSRSHPNFHGLDIPLGDIEDVRHTLLTHLKSEPALIASRFTSEYVEEVWEGVPNSIHYTILVVEEDSSLVGTKLYLSLSSVNEVQVRLVSVANTGLIDAVRPEKFPAILVLDINMGDTPDFMDKSSKNYVMTNIPDFVTKLRNASTYSEKVVPRSQEKETLNDDVVFQSGIEDALKYSIGDEIPDKDHIAGESLKALKDYVLMMAHHFPFATDGKKYFKDIYDTINNKTGFTGEQFLRIVMKKDETFGPVFMLSDIAWTGCTGSEPKFRGYHCSLWKMFHTLTVQAEANSHTNPSADPQEVLHAIIGYVKHFLGCKKCASNFLRMATTMPGNVSSFDDSILWLWRAHNSFNMMLRGDKDTEDPHYPKVQFPPASLCERCRRNGEWDLDNVLKFLKMIYSNISYIVTIEYDSSYSYASSELQIPADPAVSKVILKQWEDDEFSEINSLSFKLLLILYIFSAWVVLMSCAKVFCRRSRWKKMYSYQNL